MKTDTSEKGLESLIMRHMTGTDGLSTGAACMVAEAAPQTGGSGWVAGHTASYDREFAVDVEQLFAFLNATQPEETAKLGIGDYTDRKNIARQKFLAWLQGEISRRGTIDLLRHGLKHGALSFDLFYGTPSPENKKAVDRYAANRFSITRQLRYSRDETRRALDLCAFINGLPVMTFELKNSLTKQTVEDAVEQYKRDRDPRETLFAFGRCVVHLAVDDHRVQMCTALKGSKGTAKESWFLPFDQGWNDGAGNPPNPDGLKTDYLWKTVLALASLADIFENYAQIVEEENPKTGKKIVISTVQTFPFVLDSIGEEHRGGNFAIIIDEAHSSQGGRTAAAISAALGEAAEEEQETTEDRINRIIEQRKMLPNASYFAFTATPKNKTLEMFGIACPEAGEVKHRSFHGYTMKQAIQEGFILDVLKYYTPVASYYRLAKTVQGDPEYDVKKARKKLRLYVESHSKAIVAFSGEPEFKGAKVSEAKLNGFPGNNIADRIQEDPYRFLICADKFQTGYDEPLLHTMYVDKVLSGIKAVQTLSRLNRAHPKKRDVFVLDFQNDTKTIEESFADYYRTTILSKETDPNKLHTLKGELDEYQVYSPKQIDDQFGGLFADAKRMEERITGEIPQKVAADAKYQNAKRNSDRQNARIEHDKALKRVITALFKDDAQLFKQFQDNESFRGWLTDTVFGMTYET